MRYEKFKKKNLGRCMVAIFCTFLMVASVTTALVGSEKPNNILEIFDSLSYTFTFAEPNYNTIEADNSEYTSVFMSGCMAIGQQAGDPSLPVKSIKLLIPAMKSVSEVKVEGTSTEVELGSVDLVNKPVFPYQNPVPFSNSEPQEFLIDEELYSSVNAYPKDIQGDSHIGYSHGYTILDVAMYPLQYIPGEGMLFYYPEITVTVDLEDTSYVNPFYRNNPDDEFWVESLVCNPEITETYTSDIPTFDYPGGLCDPEDQYDYVIITTTYNELDYWETSEETPYNWESLMNKHAEDYGLSCTLVTVEDIDDCNDYHGSSPFNDFQAHIREFCKDAYQDWETKYILIGGDDENSWIPAREMDTYYEGNIDSDIYWSNLDSTFNEDSDGSWGEEGDDGFDLYCEIFIGRVTCDEPQDVSNWLTKSFYYADSGELEYLDNAGFYGGDTTWQCEGDDFMDYSAIKGTDDWLGPNPHADGPFPDWAGFQYGFETWNEVNPGSPYNLTQAWTAEPPNPGWLGGSESAAIAGFKDAINNDLVTIISGIAHANSQMSLDVGMGSWESEYHNTKPFFLHDYGCHCGDMDASDDGVLHSMLFHSDTELAFGVVYNTCYGWGNYETTNSSSAFQAKAFWDYFLDLENNSKSPSNWSLGKAHAWSKDTMAPTIDWDYQYGTWRAILQGCLLFGDPAQRLKPTNNAPEKPDQPSGETQGITNIEYTYSSTTTDVEGEDIWYMFDWGNGECSDWVGPYQSGETGQCSYTWTEPGDYEICAKAKDVNGGESEWSDPLYITIAQGPLLDIFVIRGGFFKVKTTINNIGFVEAENVDWEITLEGGNIFRGRTTTGTITSIPPQDGVQIFSDLILGFGDIRVKVTAKIPESTDSRDQGGKVYFIYVKVNPGGGS